MFRVARRLGTIAATATIASSVAIMPASAAPAPLPKAAFGMHYLGFGTSHAYPGSLGFGSARIWDDGVDWAQLQPNAPSVTCTATDLLGNCTSYATSDGWDQNALHKLDTIVQKYAAYHVDPVLVLGMTPAWATSSAVCSKYPAATCPPATTSSSSPWGLYVKTLAQRYNGHNGFPKVTYFETWNEANLSVGYTGSVATLAAMQATAHSVLGTVGASQKLLSPSYAIAYGSGWSNLTWLDHFLKSSGGKSYDVTNLHMYPAVPTAKGNYGPEAAIHRFAQVKTLLSNDGVGGRQIWDTELNEGYRYTGTAGAAQVVRLLVLGTDNHVARTFWYAADDRHWGGVWLENSDYKTYATPGVAYKWAATHLTNARPYGCSVKTVGTNKWNYTCRYHLASGKNMLVLWTTGSSFYYHGPSGTTGWYTVTGSGHSASKSTRLTVSHTPFYLVGNFSV